MHADLFFPRKLEYEGQHGNASNNGNVLYAVGIDTYGAKGEWIHNNKIYAVRNLFKWQIE